MYKYINYEYKYQKYKNKINVLLGGRTISRNSETRKKIKKSKLLTLEILSWNIGKNIEEEIFKNKILPSMGESDILVFGLQEIPVSFALPNKIIKKFKKILSNILPKYKILGDVSTCKNKVSAIEGFGIGIFILVKDEIYDKSKIIKSENDCPKKTKGYVGVTLNVNNIEIDIFNTHMPFGNIEKSNKFYNKFVEWQKKKFFNSENKIVFGDVNSRSLVTSECYDKNIKMCEEGQEPLYCQLKSKLEKISDPAGSSAGSYIPLIYKIHLIQ